MTETTERMTYRYQTIIVVSSGIKKIVLLSNVKFASYKKWKISLK